jgi:hypothetical protein
VLFLVGASRLVFLSIDKISSSSSQSIVYTSSKLNCLLLVKLVGSIL